jgi:hypothetical protein
LEKNRIGSLGVIGCPDASGSASFFVPGRFHCRLDESTANQVIEYLVEENRVLRVEMCGGDGYMESECNHAA